MTKKELLEKYDIIVDNAEASQVCIGYIEELNNIINECTEKTCNFYTEGVLRDNARELVRVQPRINVLSNLIFQNIETLTALLDDVVCIAYEIRDFIDVRTDFLDKS